MQKITLEQIYNMPIGEIVVLPICQLTRLSNEATENLQKAKLLQSWIEGALALKHAKAVNCNPLKNNKGE